ncbi:MAG: hypothetical protein ACYDHP_10695 [Ferrimicrobium sp.]
MLRLTPGIDELYLCELSEPEWLVVGGDRGVPLHPVRPNPFESLGLPDRISSMQESLRSLVERSILVTEEEGSYFSDARISNDAAQQAFDASPELELILETLRNPERAIVVEGLALGLVSSTQYYRALAATGGFVVESSMGGLRRFVLMDSSKVEDLILGTLLPSRVEDPETSSPEWIHLGDPTSERVLEEFHGAERLVRVVGVTDGPRVCDFTVISRGAKVSVLRQLGVGDDLELAVAPMGRSQLASVVSGLVRG